MADHSSLPQALASEHPIEKAFEAIVFSSRWIQAPLYGGLIVAELLYAYKFLIELWEMAFHIQQLKEISNI